MQYPNVGAPSPQEIYDALKMIPNNQQGKAQLSQLAQQGKQSGSIEGGIATALLNSYNQAQPVSPPPQGTVADQVIAQAQPPMNPNMMGLAAPGLEGVAQQNAQQMAAGGIVALAHGGPVREFDEGGWANPFDQIPDAPDTTAAEKSYFSAPPADPMSVLPETTARTVGKGESNKHSYDERIAQFQQLYGVPPDVAAEIYAKHEHDNARRSKMNIFESIAAGLGGYLGAYGSGAHRAGAGLASMLSTMGEHRREEDKEQATMDALRAKSMMLPYEQRKSIVDQLLATDTATAKDRREFAQKLKELEEQRRTQYGVAGIHGQTQTGIAEMQTGTQKEIAEANRQNALALVDKKIKAATSKGQEITGTNAIQLLKPLIDAGFDEKEIAQLYPQYIGMARQQLGGGDGLTNTSASWGNQLDLFDTEGNSFPAWVSD